MILGRDCAAIPRGIKHSRKLIAFNRRIDIDYTVYLVELRVITCYTKFQGEARSSTEDFSFSVSLCAPLVELGVINFLHKVLRRFFS